jgi:hypothetical protein
MSDFCFSRPMLERVLRHAELMDRMLERLRLDAAAAVRIENGAAWYEARTRCIACCNDLKCKDWLARSGAEAARELPEFCLNVEFLRGLPAKTSPGIAVSGFSPPPHLAHPFDGGTHDEPIGPPDTGPDIGQVARLVAVRGARPQVEG